MNEAPKSLSLPVSKLTRGMIYEEFHFFHGLVGGKRNLGENLANMPTKLVSFQHKPGSTEAFVLCANARERYAALEKELAGRREREALWAKVHEKHGFRLQDRFHFKGK